MNRASNRVCIFIIFFCFFVLLAGILACGGSDDPAEETPTVATFTVGGSVLGLQGKLVLQNKGEDDLEITADGHFTFSKEHLKDATYNVTILSRPANQNCQTHYNQGTIMDENITHVVVLCSNKSWHSPKELTDFIGPDFPVNDQEFVEIATNSSGDAIMVYPARVNPIQLFVSEYRNGSWQHPEDTSESPFSPDGTDVSEAHVAMADNGDAIVVWRQSDGVRQRLYKSEYRDGKWTHPKDLADHFSPGNDKHSNEPHVAMAANGDIIIVFFASRRHRDAHLQKRVPGWQMGRCRSDQSTERRGCRLAWIGHG